MVLCNLLDGGMSCSGPLLGPSAWQLSRCWVIWIFHVHDEFVEYSIQEPSTLARNR
jgi:hypothetical protein